MKRIVIMLVCLMLVLPTVASADYALIKNENVAAAFEKNNNVSSWLESTADNRFIFWYLVIADVQSYDPIYNCFVNEYPVFYTGIDKSHDFIHMYILDNKNNYRHVTIASSWDYLIFEETGVSQKNAKESLNKLTRSQFEMSSDEVTTLFAKYLNNQDSAIDAPEPTSTISPQTDSSVTNEKTIANLPSLSGSFSGQLMKVTVNGKQYSVREDFKNAMDKYAEYFESYIELAKSIDASAPDYLTKYAAVMQKYLEVMQALEYLDNIDNKELTDDEEAYLLYVVSDVNTKLLSAMM